MNKVLRRVIALVPAAIVQLLWLYALLRWLAPFAAVINLLLSLFAFLYVLYIFTNRNEGAYKTLWLLVILGLPVFGTILYFCVGNKRTARPLQKKIESGHALLPPAEETAPDTLRALEEQNLRLAQTFRRVGKQTGFAIHPCREVSYYPLGEQLHAKMIEDLESAEKFIYAEYFIVENGVMWDAMVEIMARKAAQGVDVRVMYDDFGSLSTYSAHDLAELQGKGIQCVRFNPMVLIKGTLNYRDHRKMLVIDGRVAFSGGVNLADEYINAVEKYGHWKDIGFRLTGEPVGNYTRMFAEFWNAFSKNPVPADNLARAAGTSAPQPSGGYVLSYYDSPLQSDAVSNSLYVELLSQATKYAWFYTPYLMLGDSLMDAFVRAAQRGVDVRIIMPGVPDKPLVYRMSRSYYQMLLEQGVKIYEYTPGFVHAKGCVMDDEVCTVGTVNLDYRSLFLHFENNALFWRAPIVSDLKADFLSTQAQCVERTLDNIGVSFRKWLVDGVLRIFAPLC